MKNVKQIQAGAVVFKITKRGVRWFVTRKDSDSDWELPKTIMRRGESSVRATLRIMGEMGGMRIRVLEEAGRTSGVINIGGSSVPQKQIYYLMLTKIGGEIIGFPEYEWLEYSKAVKRLGSKKDQTMLRQGRIVFKNWERKQKQKKE